MKMYIKESYVYALPGFPSRDGDTRWVSCNGESCGYERTLADSSFIVGANRIFLRMFKVNGVQICEHCLVEWKDNIIEALEEEE